jgi:hypothetical protein
MEAHVTPQSQSFRLRQRAEEAQIRHGQEVRADVPNVRVTTSNNAFVDWLLRKAAPVGAVDEVFFCNVGPIRIKEVLANGDDQPLPTEVMVDGFKVRESGSYDLLNVLIRSNGDIRLIVDEKTRIEPAAREGIPGYF